MRRSSRSSSPSLQTQSIKNLYQSSPTPLSPSHSGNQRMNENPTAKYPCFPLTHSENSRKQSQDRGDIRRNSSCISHSSLISLLHISLYLSLLVLRLQIQATKMEEWNSGKSMSLPLCPWSGTTLADVNGCVLLCPALRREPQQEDAAMTSSMPFQRLARQLCSPPRIPSLCLNLWELLQLTSDGRPPSPPLTPREQP